MNKKEEELQKKTFLYRLDELGDACKNLKEVAIRECGKPFLIVCDFIKSIKIATKQERDYNHVLKSLSSPLSSTSNVNIRPNPEIISIRQTTSSTYKEAEEIYDLSQEYLIPLDLLIEFTIKSGLGVMEIRGIIEKNERRNNKDRYL